MNQPAKFLVLFSDARRALLLDSEQQLIGEVIEEDGFIVASLLESASECPPPEAHQSARCYALS